jgi:predicted transposase YdaD
MEEVSKMSDMTTEVWDKTFESAGYMTRKMMLARIDEAEKKALEIARNALAEGLSIETVATITTLDIEKVRGILAQGTKPVK